MPTKRTGGPAARPPKPPLRFYELEVQMISGATWRYLLVAESDVAGAKGDWPALKGLNRI